MPEPERSWEQVVAADLDRLREQHLYRARRVVRPIDATHVEIDGRRLVNFAANNYLGLTHHPRVIEAERIGADMYGAGAGAAPLISGYGPAHASAERAIANWKGTESAVLLPSGYQANVAAVQTAAVIGRLEGGGVRFLVDKLAHASLIDAIRGTGSDFRVFPHNGVAKLHRLLQERLPGQLQVVVTESIFSMDGDAADLPALAQLKREHPFLLLLDEAHASGVYGPAGSGLAAELGLRDAVDVSVITFSKALGVIGGAVCGSSLFCAAMVNHGRAYLFSTSIPPAIAAAAENAIAVCRSEPERQRRVRDLARRVRAALAATALEVPPGDSPIVPIIVGDEHTALDAAAQLSAAGLLVVAVRPPTVAKGASRMRVTLSSEHTDEEVELLVREVTRLEVAQRDKTVEIENGAATNAGAQAIASDHEISE